MTTISKSPRAISQRSPPLGGLVGGGGTAGPGGLRGPGFGRDGGCLGCLGGGLGSGVLDTSAASVVDECAQRRHLRVAQQRRGGYELPDVLGGARAHDCGTRGKSLSTLTPAALAKRLATRRVAGLPCLVTR